MIKMPRIEGRSPAKFFTAEYFGKVAQLAKDYNKKRLINSSVARNEAIRFSIGPDAELEYQEYKKGIETLLTSYLRNLTITPPNTTYTPNEYNGSIQIPQSNDIAIASANLKDSTEDELVPAPSLIRKPYPKFGLPTPSTLIGLRLLGDENLCIEDNIRSAEQQGLSTVFNMYHHGVVGISFAGLDQTQQISFASADGRTEKLDDLRLTGYFVFGQK